MPMLVRLLPVCVGVELGMSVLVLRMVMSVGVARRLVLGRRLIGPVPVRMGVRMPVLMTVFMAMRMAVDQIPVAVLMLVHMVMRVRVPVLVLVAVLALAVVRLVRVVVG